MVHTPHGTARLELPWTFSTFDYPELCALLRRAVRRRLRDRQGERPHRQHRPHRPRRPDRPARGRRARLAARAGRRLPAARRPALARPRGAPVGRRRARWRSGSTAATCPPATAGASRRATSCASASARSTRASTSRTRPCMLAEDLERDPVRYQGNWIPHQLRDATEDGVFFVGDSAGHCLPLTAEGIRTALYFGIACGRELRAVVEGRQTPRRRSRATATSPPRTSGSSAGMLGAQRLVPTRAAAAADTRAAGDAGAALRRLVLRPLPGASRPPAFACAAPRVSARRARPGTPAPGVGSQSRPARARDRELEGVRGVHRPEWPRRR